ncbi:MAG: hypothetical protein ACHQET_06365 [Chitinophagales bacterium]
MLTPALLKPWKSPEKILFRFFFLFLGFFALTYAIAPILFSFKVRYKSIQKMFGLLSKSIYWLDQHIYHIGYDPKRHESLPGDNYYGLVYFLTLLILAMVACIIWSWIDRRRADYDRLYYWFRVYLRYTIAIIMFWYGIGKLIPEQMAYPDAEQLLKPLGERSRYDMVWSFMGVSPPYQMFTGFCEVVASVLLLFRRTYVFGSLLMCTILVNVVMLNIWYNIPVKIYSSLLLICVFFVLIPFYSRLVKLFFYQRAESLNEKYYNIQNRLAKWIFFSLRILLICYVFASLTISTIKDYRKIVQSYKQGKIYEVTNFVAGDTLSPLLTDTLRWKRFVLDDDEDAVVYNMQDVKDFYSYTVDSSKKTISLHNNPDSTKWSIFHYQYSEKGTLHLSGEWKKKEVSILMKEIPIDSMALNNDKVSLIHE